MSSAQENIIPTLKPDINNECFNRPDLISNRSVGISQFASITKVYNKDYSYVLRDIMFIKATVNTEI